MTRHDDTVNLRHMLEHAVEAIQLARNKTIADIYNNRLLFLGLSRLLEIIGEAAGRTSESTRNNIPQLPWNAIVAMRNRLIHGYDQVDFNVLWDTIQNDLPPLAEELKKYLPV
jgi:uncharacterized protein with HEPN domain